MMWDNWSRLTSASMQGSTQGEGMASAVHLGFHEKYRTLGVASYAFCGSQVRDLESHHLDRKEEEHCLVFLDFAFFCK